MRLRSSWKQLATVASISGAIGILALWPSQAAADNPYAFVQLTCATDLHYAAVRRFVVLNPVGFDESGSSSPAQTSTERQDKIFTSRSLAQRPTDCRIPSSDTPHKGRRAAISLLVTANVDSSSKGQDRVDEVRLALDGKPVGTIWMGLKYEASGTDSIEIFADGVGLTLRTCGYDVGSDSKITCTARSLTAPQ